MSDTVLDIFREEAREHLSALERIFLDLEAAPPEKRRGLIDSLFRHAHSLKGDAKAVGLLPLKAAAQVLEDQLDLLRSAPEEMTSKHISQGLLQFDTVRKAFETFSGFTDPGMPADNSGSSSSNAVAVQPAPASPSNLAPCVLVQSRSPT